MPDEPELHLTAETLRRLAREHVEIDLPDDQVDPLLQQLNGLLDEIRRIPPADRSGVEPMTAFSLGEWPRD
jgi:hypothetical protein